MSITSLREAYLNRSLEPQQLVESILERCEQYRDHNIWISLLSLEQIGTYIHALSEKAIEDYPLWGIPFAIKDNIDLAGVKTTAACPSYAYIPEQSAFVVEQLIAAGAIPIGKTNLDQFATGLVGTRSPYGACRNSIRPEMISGGSSSGSAVAVALGMVSFSLGTDTAGSGRIPAFLNNIVGVKPTVGSLSSSGMIPACRSLDSMSIFTQNIDDAKQIFALSAIYDQYDDYARPHMAKTFSQTKLTIGVPEEHQLEWFGNEESPDLFKQTLAQLESAGARLVSVDFSSFKKAADLLYSGPWVAERYAAMEKIFTETPDILHPITKAIVEKAKNYSAVDTFKAMYQLQAYKKQADNVLTTVDCIVTPTAGTYYTIDEVEADPIQLNTNLGYYTNFMNLLDYSALAVPFGAYDNAMPFGITLFAEAGADYELMSVANLLENIK